MSVKLLKLYILYFNINPLYIGYRKSVSNLFFNKMDLCIMNYFSTIRPRHKKCIRIQIIKNNNIVNNFCGLLQNVYFGPQSEN